MLEYGSDKPDLRNPIKITDVTSHFAGGGFGLFAKVTASGGVVRAIPAPGAAGRPRSFFDGLNDWAKAEGQGGLGYIAWDADGAKGPIAKNLEADRVAAIAAACGLGAGDAVFFVANKEADAAKFSGAVRNRVGRDLGLLEENAYRFCWVTDFPMYERNEDTGQIEFSHNPFSMPQGGLEALNSMDPLDIKAFQYDIVCNGIELSSGAIRNHRPDIMIRAFEIAGYPAEEVEHRFGGMLNAFRYGAPPHGGSAPGIDRIVMLIADEPAGGRFDDGRAGPRAAGTAQGIAHQVGPAAGEGWQAWLICRPEILL
jgi:aspartyl-tRNA synthetase